MSTPKPKKEPTCLQVLFLSLVFTILLIGLSWITFKLFDSKFMAAVAFIVFFSTVSYMVIAIGQNHKENEDKEIGD